MSIFRVKLFTDPLDPRLVRKPEVERARKRAAQQLEKELRGATWLRCENGFDVYEIPAATPVLSRPKRVSKTPPWDRRRARHAPAALPAFAADAPTVAHDS